MILKNHHLGGPGGKGEEEQCGHIKVDSTSHESGKIELSSKTLEVSLFNSKIYSLSQGPPPTRRGPPYNPAL